MYINLGLKIDMIDYCKLITQAFFGIKNALILFVAILSLSVSVQAGVQKCPSNVEYWRIPGLNRLRAAALQHKIDRIEVYYLPLYAETIVTSTPESLEQGYQYHFEERDLKYSLREKSLVSAVGMTKMLKLNTGYRDMRIGVIFFDRNDHRITSVYFNAIPKGANIDGIYYELSDKGLFDWVKTSYISKIDAMILVNPHPWRGIKIK